MPELYRDPAQPAAPEYHVHRAPGRDLSDTGEVVWDRAATVTWGPPRWRTRFRALWSDAGLVIRFDCTDECPWHTMTRRDDHLWEEEVVEIFIDPAMCGRDYAEIEISPANVVCDLRIHQPWPDLLGDKTWDFDGLVTTVKRPSDLTSRHSDWVAVAALPWRGFESLSPEAAERLPPRPGDRWRFNVFRIKRPGGRSDPERDAVYAAWSVPNGPSFHDPAVFRDMVFA